MKTATLYSFEYVNGDSFGRDWHPTHEDAEAERQRMIDEDGYLTDAEDLDGRQWVGEVKEIEVVLTPEIEASKRNVRSA